MKQVKSEFIEIEERCRRAMIGDDPYTTAAEQAKQWREWAMDDVRRWRDYQIFDLRRRYDKRIEGIEATFNARIAAANPPKLIKVQHGMVLFA